MTPKNALYHPLTTDEIELLVHHYEVLENRMRDENSPSMMAQIRMDKQYWERAREQRKLDNNDHNRV